MKAPKINSIAVIAALVLIGWKMAPDRRGTKTPVQIDKTAIDGEKSAVLPIVDGKREPPPRQTPPPRQHTAVNDGRRVLMDTGGRVPSLQGVEVIDVDEMEARIRTSTRFCTRALNPGTTELRLISPAEAGATATWEVVSGEVPEDAKACLDEMLASLPDAITTSPTAHQFVWAVDKVSPAKAYPYR